MANCPECYSETRVKAGVEECTGCPWWWPIEPDGRRVKLQSVLPRPKSERDQLIEIAVKNSARITRLRARVQYLERTLDEAGVKYAPAPIASLLTE